MGQGHGRIDGMTTYESVMREIIGEQRRTMPVFDPYHHPAWLNGVAATMPLDYIRRACGRMGGVLASEAIAAEQYRAKAAFSA